MSKQKYNEDAIKGVVKDLVVEGLEYKIEHSVQGYKDGMDEPPSVWVAINDNKVFELCVQLYGKNAGTVICDELLDNDIGQILVNLEEL
jgi:hypothetical protein